MIRRLSKMSLVVFMLTAFCLTACGTSGKESKGSQNLSEKDSLIGEDENVSVDENVVDTVVDKYLAIAESANTTFVIPEDSIAFMDAHEEFFPGNENNDGAMSDFLNYEVDYPHLSKSIGKYTGELFSVYGKIVDIKEIDNGNVTYLHVMDYNDYNYTFYYLGTIENAFEGSEVSIYALPFNMITFENMGGAYTEAVVGAACYVYVYEYDEYEY